MKFLWRSYSSSSTCASFLRWKLRCGAQCCTSSTSSSSTVAPGFHVTVPIFYVNSDPHIGHLYSALLADAMFRWRLLRAGHLPQTSAAAGSSSFDIANFHFSAGTDEHGKKIEEAASARGASTVQQHCDAVSQRFAQLFRHFGISNTQFVRTSEARHVQAVTHFWKKLEDGGHIQPDTYEGWYSTADECFYTDSEVMDGTLADGAYGKVSIETHASVFKISEPNYTFNLAPFYDRIRRWISRPGVLTPIHFRGHVLEHICNPSLAKLSVSRPTSRCPWGIPVPGDPTQTIYIWLDALVNYLTAVGYPTGNGTELHSWPPTIQILGKDIFRFHAIFWPAFLLAANLPLPQRLFVHAHWLVDKRKMSKSVGNVVCPFRAAELLSVDGLRYFLLKQNPVEDGNFSLEKAVTVINSYLVNDLGNLLQRAINPKLNPGQQYPGGFGGEEIFDEIADADGGAAAAGETARRLVNELRTLPDRLVDHFDRLEVHRALELLVDVVQLANLFFQQKKPWKSAVGREHVDSVLFLAYETVRLTAIFLQPVTPQFADKLLSILGIQTTERRLEMASFMAMAAGEQGSTSKKPRSLGGRNEQQQIFPRIIYDKKDV